MTINVSAEQASSIEQISTSLSEVASQTKQNAENSSKANILIFEVKDNTVKGNERMKDMLKSMVDIYKPRNNKYVKQYDE